MVRTRKAFTLIELLVVMLVVGVAFGVLFPALTGLDRVKKETACAWNLKGIYGVLTAYTSMNQGRYPYPVDTTYGSKFYGDWVAEDPWAGVAHVRQMKLAGADASLFFCPFDPDYGKWDTWPCNSWLLPYRLDRPEGDRACVFTGYTMFIYRSYPYQTARFADGSIPACDDLGDDDVPIVADTLCNGRGGHGPGGWWHGGWAPDGLGKASCNTLFKSGEVVTTAAGGFDWEKPSLVMGAPSNRWWCALADDN